MYDIDKKYFNKDGSLDCDAACASGRKARAGAAGECAAFFKAAITGLFRSTGKAFSALAMLISAQSAR